MKLMLTGGHLAPALAIIEELQNIKKNGIDIIFVGRKYALDSEKTLSLEYKEITKRNINFINLATGRFSRIFNWQSVKSWLRIPGGFLNAFLIIFRYKPDTVLSFGGYIALPVSFWAYIFRIPVYTHEQTICPGIANRIIAFFSKKVFVAFAEAKKLLPPQKTIVTGNPIRTSIISINKYPFKIKKTLPVIYITGGSLGSHSINQIIKEIIATLLQGFIVIHQTGETKEFHDYEDLLAVKNSMPKELSERYFLVKHLYDDEIGAVFHQADLVVSRAGANTFFELVALGKPAIFIPLPWSANGEQEKQAQLFVTAGTGEIFYQQAKPQQLAGLIDKMATDLTRYRKNFPALQHLYVKNATQFIIEEVIQVN